MRIFHRILVALTVFVGFGALHTNIASASPPCPSGYCDLVVAPKSCKRVEVINANHVNLRAANAFKSDSNIIGVASRGDVYKLRRCKKDGCKIILQTDQGKVGAWIHRNYVTCTAKKRYQQCGLFSVQQTSRYPSTPASGNTGSHGWSYTSENGNFRLTLTPPAGSRHHHHHHYAGAKGPPYGNLRISFNIAASVH